MLESLAAASSVCRDFSVLIITLPWTVWGQSQNPIFILNTPLLHAGSPVCYAGWLNLLVWVETCELQPLVPAGFGGAWGSLGGWQWKRVQCLGLDACGTPKLGGAWSLSPNPLFFKLCGHWDEQWEKKAASSSWEWGFWWLNFHSWEPPTGTELHNYRRWGRFQFSWRNYSAGLRVTQ